MKPFFVYMLECSDRSFYVGHTDDLETRIAQHESGVFGGHTAALRPVKLVWSQELVERDEAFWIERKLKGWSRAKKRALIEGDWSSIRALSAPRTGPDLRKCRSDATKLSTSGEERERPLTLSLSKGEPVEGRANAGPSRSCFDKLSTSGSSESTLTDLSPARPEPVEGRAANGSH